MNAYTDGSSRGNPGPGGWAVIMKDGNRVTEHAGREAETTNNRMELAAVIHALKLAKGKSVTIHTDSQYVMNGATRWISGWKRNGWKTASRAPVLNQDLWQELDQALADTDSHFVHVRGHAGHPENERADEIATSSALGKAIDLYSGDSAGYSPVPMKAASAPFPARSKEFYVSDIAGDIVIHDNWDDCQARIEGFVARFKKALSEEDARAIAVAWKNS
jgi:ribonuclease HI